MIAKSVWLLLVGCFILLAAGCGQETAVSPTPTPAFPGPTFILFYTNN